MHISTITLFPEMFDALHYGVVGRAIGTEQLTLQHWNPRDYTTDKHRTVDDRPYGGGPGMVLRPEPVCAAIDAAKTQQPSAPVIYLSPKGKQLNQQDITDLAQLDALILLSGRYEGVDERIIETRVDQLFSIGDYVLSGGELPAMVMIDAIARMRPGVLGHNDSAEQDSFIDGLLDTPHYTRPEKFANLSVPEVLLSGDHSKIALWRHQQALGQTWLRRPDLLEKRTLTQEEQKLLDEFIKNTKK